LIGTLIVLISLSKTAVKSTTTEVIEQSAAKTEATLLNVAVWRKFRLCRNLCRKQEQFVTVVIYSVANCISFGSRLRFAKPEPETLQHSIDLDEERT